MAQYNKGFKAFTAGEALNARCRVKLNSSGNAVYSDAGEYFIGVTENAVASGEIVTVRLWNTSGSFKMRCDAAVTARTFVYGAADGEIDDLAAGSAIGFAPYAGSGAGSIIEVIPFGGAVPGEDGTGADFVLYGDTTGAEVTFDQSANEMLFDGIDIGLQDADIINFGDANDITMTWDGTRFVVNAAAANTEVRFGVDGTGLDLRLYGDTTGSFVLWDQSAMELLFDGTDIGLQDNDIINFGDANDITMTWNGTKFLINAAAANTEVALGVDGTGVDFRLYGDATGANVLWDQSGNELIFSTGSDIDLTADAVMIDFKAGASSTKSPTSDTEAGWINVNVGGSLRKIPYYT